MTLRMQKGVLSLVNIEGQYTYACIFPREPDICFLTIFGQRISDMTAVTMLKKHGFQWENQQRSVSLCDFRHTLVVLHRMLGCNSKYSNTRNRSAARAIGSIRWISQKSCIRL